MSNPNDPGNTGVDPSEGAIDEGGEQRAQPAEVDPSEGTEVDPSEVDPSEVDPSEEPKK